MLKLSKLLFIFALLLGACTPTPMEQELIQPDAYWLTPFANPIGQKVMSPTPTFPLLINPIETSMIEIDEGFYIQISGLVNQQVQQAINQQIKDKAEELLLFSEENPPPYRGIQTMLQDYFFDHKNISADISYNANFVLSVNFYFNMLYEHAFQAPINIQVQDGLTFDLNTGKTLSLSDLLTNDVDAKGWYNSTMSSQYFKQDQVKTPYYWATITLLQPFKGLRSNQKFFLSNSSVHLIFDYETFELDLSTYSLPLTLNFRRFKDQFALPLRFVTSESIFEKPISDGYFPYTDDVEPAEWEILEIAGQNVQVSYTKYPSFDDIPDEYISDMLIEFKQKIVASDSDIQDAFFNFHITPIQSYTTIWISYHLNYANGESITRDMNQTFDANGKKMSSNDLVPEIDSYQDEIKEYLSLFPLSDFGIQLKPSEIEYQISSLSLNMDGFYAIVYLQGYDEPFNFTLPFKIFNIRTLEFFKSALTLLDSSH